MSEEIGEYKVEREEGKLCKNCIHNIVCRFKARMAGAEKVEQDWEEDRRVVDPEDPTNVKAVCSLREVKGGIR